MTTIYIIVLSFQNSNCNATVLYKYIDLGQLIFLFVPNMAAITYSFAVNVYRSIRSSEYNAKIQQDQTTGATGSSYQLKSLKQTTVQFKMVLEDNEGSQLFQKFLEQEWSVENILFWKVAVDFRTSFPSYNTEEASSMFKEICERYVVEESALCVNLPYQVRQKLTKMYVDAKDAPDSPSAGSSSSRRAANVTITSDVFIEAEEEIFNLMMKDPFRRFCLSPGPEVKQLLSRF
eukprot:TRINITY_DN5917_c0_g2_i1.p1 TRINITY_DN5917_c0_g2~~TRINITY_DN5917_c0_g2_i1.p1  ORF type:complete len:233 (-),score=43.07 TRINITY_DN5917_c0_g2_i1:133-831(-)